MMRDRVPPPTPRTAASPSGFAVWCRWAEDEEERLRRDDQKPWYESNRVPRIAGYKVRFDAAVYAKTKLPCLYCTSYKSEWFLDILSIPEAASGGRKGQKVAVHSDSPERELLPRANVFGNH